MIVVTAPTGLVGHQVLENLLDRDEPVRVIARDPNRLAAGVRERVEVVQGSHTDRDVVDKTFDCADSVFLAAAAWTHKLRGWSLRGLQPASERDVN